MMYTRVEVQVQLKKKSLLFGKYFLALILFHQLDTRIIYYEYTSITYSRY